MCHLQSISAIQKKNYFEDNTCKKDKFAHKLKSRLKSEMLLNQKSLYYMFASLRNLSDLVLSVTTLSLKALKQTTMPLLRSMCSCFALYSCKISFHFNVNRLLMFTPTVINLENWD